MNDSSLQRINFENLARNHRETPRCERAIHILTGPKATDRKLRILLRDHNDESIESRAEQKRRDDIDWLLDYYSIIELASIAGFVPAALPSGFVDEASHILAIPALREYYGEYYEQILPELLYLRVTGRNSLRESKRGAAQKALLELLGYANELWRDEDMDWLLAFLDDYVIDDESWEDLQDCVAKPRKYFEALQIKPQDQTALDSAVHGFRKYVAFATNFAAYLDRLEEVPYFRSGAWHYFEYWFSHFDDKIGPVLEQALGNLLATEADRLNTKARKQIAKEAAQQRSILNGLMHTSFRRPLEVALQDMRAT